MIVISTNNNIQQNDIKKNSDKKTNKINQDFVTIDFNSNFGLYLHIPFCHTLCNYCDYYSETSLEKYLKKFLEALKQEIKIYSNHLSCKKLRTIYIGGGTPSLLPVDKIEEILQSIFENFSLPKENEITLEANPCSIELKKLQKYKKAGINRLSLGIQSFKDDQLKLLGRSHTPDKAIKVIKKVEKIFDNYNLDLIFAIPKQTLSDWRYSLKLALKFSPAHISLYNLEIKKGTPLSKKIAGNKLNKISEELDVEMYNMAQKLLTKNNYHQYEISNFAKQGCKSRHNMLYWKFKPYLGLGPGAHSFNGKNRFYNCHDLKKYICFLTNINSNQQKSKTHLAVSKIDSLNKNDLHTEMIIMGLRLIRGVDKKDFKNKFGVKIENIYGKQIKELKKQGLIKDNDNYLSLTDRGLLLGNKVFRKFI